MRNASTDSAVGMQTSGRDLRAAMYLALRREAAPDGVDHLSPQILHELVPVLERCPGDLRPPGDRQAQFSFHRFPGRAAGHQSDRPGLVDLLKPHQLEFEVDHDPA